MSDLVLISGSYIFSLIMNQTQIESKLKLLVSKIDKENFIYSFLEAYNLPKASITRLQKGSLNLSKVTGEVSWKKKLFFKAVTLDMRNLLV